MKTLTKNGLELNTISETEERTGGGTRVNVWKGEESLILDQVATVRADPWYQSHTVERSESGFAALTVNYAQPFQQIEWSRTVEAYTHTLFEHPRWVTPKVWTGNPAKKTIRTEVVLNAVEARNPVELEDGTGDKADEIQLYRLLINGVNEYEINTYTLHYQLQYNRAFFPNPVQFSDRVLIFSYAKLNSSFGSLSVANNAPELVQTNGIPHVGQWLSSPAEMRVRTDGVTEMNGMFRFALFFSEEIYFKA
jgi:hypothetical protein